ncbi:hypothetical protein [Plantactinospora sp. KBS50]|uniref:hypothetical protein n=1 Tax=Plantactinospora sp. KBS50 TaxID=2024580 RepID=UPI000BAAD70E|nr:hypothetical protein [Plantactinospora sp. KBS50]ASW55881.1 hypothetical protein CIK06_19455 [Plantactinospora sp. KBS50]
MPRIGITGHVRLANGTAELVYECLAAHLASYAGGELHGVTCLADGADQLFARAVLAHGGDYEAIIPALDYRTAAVAPENRTGYDELLDRARSVSYLAYPHSGRPAYLAASEELLRRSERLVAVWDGERSGDPGGTAHLVRLARDRGLPVTVLWPAGARRS